MTKVPVGDQPADIELQIRAMITEFIARPNCLILAVSPANSDLATSDALQLAQSLDPAGTRTIGVLTKLDLMDHDTHAGEILRNQVIPLRFGYMAVVNRSQRDIEGRKNIDAAIDSEREFFSSHTVYGGTELREKCGTENLRKLLNLHLTRHIAAALPNLKQTLRARIHQLNEALAGWRSDFDYSDAQWRAKAAIRLAIAFAESFRVELLGNSDSQLNHQSLSSGAKIMLLFHRRFKEKILQTEWTQESLMKRQIGYAIENVKGVRPGMFTPDQAFDRIIREQIHHLREPIFEILDSVETEMVEAIGKSVDAGTLHRFPELASLIKGRARMAVGENADKARERITQLLSWENAYINTKHEDFVTFEAANTEASRRVQKRRNPGETVKKESWLYLNQGGLMKKKYWFVLTMDNILWYSDETKGDRIYMIPLSDNISFEDKGSNKFAIQGPSKNIYKASSFDEFEDWTRCLMQVGVFPVGDEGRGRSLRDKTTSGAILDGTSDADLERQIESLWILVGSYMTIICTTLMDVVPKCLVRSLIRDSVEWTATDLVTIVARLDSYEDLMEEDEGERQRKEEMEGSVGALSRALERLGSLDIPVAELPPPLHPTPMSALRPAPPKPVRVPKPPPKPRSQSQGAHQMGTVLAFPRDVTRKSSSGVKKEVAKALRTLDSTQKSKFY